MQLCARNVLVAVMVTVIIMMVMLRVLKIYDDRDASKMLLAMAGVLTFVSY